MAERLAWAVGVLAVGCGPRVVTVEEATADGSLEGGDVSGGDPSSSSSDTGESIDTGDPGVPDPTGKVALHWVQQFDNPEGVDAFCDVATLPDGTIAVSGTTSNDVEQQNGGAGWIARFSWDGEPLGVTDLPVDHAPLSMSADISGRLFVVGTKGRFDDSPMHFFLYVDFEGGVLWEVSQATGWSYVECGVEGNSAFGDSAALEDGTLVARYEHDGSSVRLFDPAGSIVADVDLGGYAGGYHTVAATGSDTFASIGQYFAPTWMGDDWAVMHIDSSGNVLWQQTGDGFPGELLAAASEAWHFVWSNPSGAPLLHRHAVVDGTFVTVPVPPEIELSENVAYWANTLVVLDEYNDTLLGYTHDLEPVWTFALDVPDLPFVRRLVTGRDGALYVISGGWIARLILE